MEDSISLKILRLGHMECAKYHLVETEDKNEQIISPVTAVLIRHPQLGIILFDTGCDDLWELSLSDEMRSNYPIKETVTVKDALSKEGLAPSDVDLLILSHLHFDHAGGLKFFAGTDAGKRALVSAADAKEAFYRTGIASEGYSGAYMGCYFNAPGIGFSPVEDKLELAPDLKLFSQPCHTPGVLGMVVRLRNSGVVLFTGDTVYTHESYERELPPGGTINATDDEFFDNLKTLKDMQKKLGATVFYGHDIRQADSWSARGWIN